jgi:pimeloyl-ACP methyl ester carboxylesterase
MPFVTNRDVRIHYETIGNGPALVMHHGTFGSGADFIDLGYVDALKADHQVILLDSRGHGQSDKPHDSNCYDLALRASDVLAVLDELGTRKADISDTRWAAGSDLILQYARRNVSGLLSLVGPIPTPKTCSHSAT